MAFVGNDPGGFDPGRRTREAERGGGRGRRFRWLLLGGVSLAVPGILAQRYVQDRWSGGDGEKPREIKTVRTEPPPFRFETAKETPPPRAPERGVEPAKPAPAPVPPRRDERPTRLAFDVRVQGEPDMAWFQDGRRPKLAPGCALRPGASVIHAALESTVRSEVAGQAVATVTEDVHDADGVGRLLIPAGTKAVGVYKAGGSLGFQRRRLDFVWNELTMPDGTQIDLGGADGMDVAGSMGVGGEVDARWGELVATAALLTVFDGIQRGGVPGDPGLLGRMQDAASGNAGRLGKEITGRVLDWEPDVLVRGGTRITIATRKTVRVC